VREYQETATALPLSLPPVAPSAGLKARVMAAATGRKAPRRALLSRVFWAAAAIALFALILQSLTGPNVKRFEGKDGAVRWEDRTVHVKVSGLPALPAGKVYQLWHLGPQPNPVRCRTFTLQASGVLEGDDTMQYAIAKEHRFALTVEPVGGSDAPTMPIIAITP
jgi:anti-sigma-K factor RskA